jgi:hypothetical protein
MTDQQQTNPPEETTLASVLAAFFDHQTKAGQLTGRALNALIPPDFKTYSAEAREEFLKSFKVLLEGVVSVVDKELEKVRNAATTAASEPSASAGPTSTTGKSKVKVEVN